MKKTITIASISVFILLAIGVWGYILINDPGGGAEPTQNADFTSAPTADREFTDAESNSNNRAVSLDAPLIQLTERPVAGATFANVDDTTHVRYIERGTGHVFQISLDSGEETRISGTTIPKTVDAVWSPSGSRAALTIEREPYKTETYVAHLTTTDNGEQQLDGFSLSKEVHSPAFDTVGDTLFYAVAEERRTVGYAENLKTGERSTVFEIPFTQIEVLWGDPVHIYNKPSAQLQGFLYEVQDTSLERISGGRGLTAKKKGDALLVSKNENGERTTRFYNPTTESAIEIGVAGYLEKCTLSNSTSTADGLWCIDPLELSDDLHPDDWYKGERSFEDMLWRVDLETGTSTMLSNTRVEVDKSLDAVEVKADLTNSYLIFKNKADNTLWLYDLRELD